MVFINPTLQLFQILKPIRILFCNESFCLFIYYKSLQNKSLMGFKIWRSWRLGFMKTKILICRAIFWILCMNFQFWSGNPPFWNLDLQKKHEKAFPWIATSQNLPGVQARRRFFYCKLQTEIRHFSPEIFYPRYLLVKNFFRLQITGGISSFLTI